MTPCGFPQFMPQTRLLEPRHGSSNINIIFNGEGTPLPPWILVLWLAWADLNGQGAVCSGGERVMGDALMGDRDECSMDAED